MKQNLKDMIFIWFLIAVTSFITSFAYYDQEYTLFGFLCFQLGVLLMSFISSIIVYIKDENEKTN